LFHHRLSAVAAEVLLDIYLHTDNTTHRLLALRGFVRLLALPAQNRPVQKTQKMCRRAMSHAESIAEKKLVLSGLANVGDAKPLIVVEPFLRTEEIRAEAAIAVIKIARPISQTDPGKALIAMNKLLAGLQDEKLTPAVQRCPTTNPGVQNQRLQTIGDCERVFFFDL